MNSSESMPHISQIYVLESILHSVPLVHCHSQLLPNYFICERTYRNLKGSKLILSNRNPYLNLREPRDIINLSISVEHFMLFIRDHHPDRQLMKHARPFSVELYFLLEKLFLRGKELSDFCSKH